MQRNKSLLILLVALFSTLLTPGFCLRSEVTPCLIRWYAGATLKNSATGVSSVISVCDQNVEIGFCAQFLIVVNVAFDVEWLCVGWVEWKGNVREFYVDWYIGNVYGQQFWTEQPQLCCSYYFSITQVRGTTFQTKIVTDKAEWVIQKTFTSLGTVYFQAKGESPFPSNVLKGNFMYLCYYDGAKWNMGWNMELFWDYPYGARKKNPAWVQIYRMNDNHIGTGTICKRI